MFLHDDPGYHCIPKSRVTNDKKPYLMSKGEQISKK